MSPHKIVMLSGPKISMLSGPKNLLSGIIRLNYRFRNLLQSVVSSFRAFELDYHVPFLGARTSDITLDIDSYPFLCNASMSTCGHYILVANMFWKNNDASRFVQQQFMRTDD